MSNHYHNFVSEKPELKWVPLTFELNPIDEVNLPDFAGSTIRGGFGWALKKVVCIVRHGECPNCRLIEHCPYFKVFENKEEGESTGHPFVLEPPPSISKIYQKHEPIIFQMILFGDAVTYLPYYIYTFIKLGDLGIGKGRGKFTLSRVLNKDNIIYTQEDEKLKDPSYTYSLSQFLEISEDARLIQICFLTPARIKFQNSLTDELDFEIFMRSIFRRITNLVNNFGKGSFKLDFQSLLEESQYIQAINSNLGWYDLDRYSHKQRTKMKMGGILGDITFKGDNLKKFIPFIRIGEIVHIGKNTGFGLGKYAVVKVMD